ncbi:MAG TPA: hypothetical protein VGE62_01150 [Candidatus Paceibacterota bacterium]
MAEKEKKTVELYIDKELTECVVEIDHNNEFICTVPVNQAKDADNGKAGRFVKFPEGDLNKMVTEFNRNNAPKE